MANSWAPAERLSCLQTMIFVAKMHNHIIISLGADSKPISCSLMIIRTLLLGGLTCIHALGIRL